MGRPIKAEVASHLSHTFPDLDLSRVRLLESLEGGFVEWAMRRNRIEAMCFGRFIAIAGRVDEREPAGMALVAHELTHVRQIQEVGVLRFYAAYLRAYLRGLRHGLTHHEAYHHVPFEAEAREVATVVRADQESGLVAVGAPPKGGGAKG